MHLIMLAISVCLLQADATFRCKTKIMPVGCFKDKRSDRALPTQLLNERDATSDVYNGRLIQWKDPNYLSGFACRCAQKARCLGHMYFGIQFYGECWSGPKSHLTYNKYGKSSACKMSANSQPTCHIETGKGNSNYVYKIIDRQCEADYSPIGCFSDSQIKPRPVPNYGMNERDKSADTWNGHVIDWKNWATYLPQLICRCAQVAKDFGHDIFAIQFYGECWTGKRTSSNYRRDGKSNKCVGGKFKSCKCHDYHCAGVQKVNYVYQLNRGRRIAQDVLPYHYQSHSVYHGFPEYKDDRYFRRYQREDSRRYAEYE